MQDAINEAAADAIARIKVGRAIERELSRALLASEFEVTAYLSASDEWSPAPQAGRLLSNSEDDELAEWIAHHGWLFP